MKDFKTLKENCQSRAVKKKIAVVSANSKSVLMSILEAYKEGLVQPVLIGNSQEIMDKLKALEYGLIDKIEIVESSDENMTKVALDYVRSGAADIIMKGAIETAPFMSAIVKKENGALKDGNLLNHITILEIPGYHKLVGITDAALLMYPSIEEKKIAIDNSISYLKKIGFQEVKVSILAAIEKINPKMPETVEADLLKKRYREKKIPGCYVEGPISYDLAMDKRAALEKHYCSPVAGDSDLLVVNNIISGNLLVKSLTHSAKAVGAGIVLGANIPVVLTSRASSAEAKYRSILLAAAM